MIIAVKDKDRVVVGSCNGDFWSGYTDKTLCDPDNVPIRFTEDGTLFACSHTDARSDLLLYNEELLQKEITPKSMEREISPFVKKTMEEAHFVENNHWGNALLVCRDNRLFDLSPTFTVSEVGDFACHGIKLHLLFGVLDMNADKDAEARIVEAYTFYERATGQRLFPIVISDTKTKETKIVYEGGTSK